MEHIKKDVASESEAKTFSSPGWSGEGLWFVEILP
jgi:hypothetical protein